MPADGTEQVTLEHPEAEALGVEGVGARGQEEGAQGLLGVGTVEREGLKADGAGLEGQAEG